MVFSMMVVVSAVEATMIDWCQGGCAWSPAQWWSSVQL
jgi:hypothetical protein